MDLLNKIKLMFASEQEKEEETIEEIIRLEDLPNKLESKINELTKLKKQLREEISKRVFSFEIDINERITSLENIDISQKREYDKIKIIVKENLDLYISYLKRTINNIKKADKEEIEEYISELSRILNEFHRVSSKSFEKATILIGEELSSTRKIIKSFIQDINKTVDANKSIFDKGMIYNSASDLLSESKQITSLHTKIESRLSEMNAILENAGKEQNMLKNKLLEIKEGEDFKRDNLEKNNYRKQLDSLEKDIHAIKRKLDLKKLLKRFHHDKKIDQLLRRYADNFKDALKEDKELRIIDIIGDNDMISPSNLKEIQNTIISLIPLSPSKIDLEIAFLEDRIKEKSAHILNSENNIKNEIKRKEKLSMKLEKVNSDLMENAKLL